jgi:hypothetical protein
MSDNNASPSGITLDLFMNTIRDGDDAVVAKLKGDPRSGGVNREFLVSVAASLNISGARRKTNDSLFESVITRIKNQAMLEQIETDEDSVDSEASQPTRKFRKDKNTLPRILNILMTNPDAILRTNLLANRRQLQSREVYSNQTIFIDCAERFNDPDDDDIGGLVAQHH